MAKYRVWVCLEVEYDDIEADNEEEAFIEASDCAMSGGDWQYRVEKIDDDEKICPCDDCEEQYDCGDCDIKESNKND